MSETDELARKTGLTAEQRKERARAAGTAAHSLTRYVSRISRNADDLTADDLEKLRQVVGPVEAPEVFASGLKAGAKLAVEHMIAAASAVVAS